MRKSLALMALLWLTAATEKEDATVTISSANEKMHHGRYIESIKMLENIAFDARGNIINQEAFSVWCQYVTSIYNELPIGVLDLRSTKAPSNKKWVNALEDSTPRDAIKEIVKRARNTSIVILNEAHYSPRDRVFSLQVAIALRKLGYLALAIETLDNQRPEVSTNSPLEEFKKDHIVRYHTGYYTVDPVFAGFIRQAVSIGYEPYGYEITRDQASADQSRDGREEAEANNLMTSIFKDHPHKKTLIYVGFSHVYEEPVGTSKVKYMAYRLKHKTGIDPLTIDQTTIADDAPQSRAAYEVAAKRIKKSSIFFGKGGPLILSYSTNNPGVDLQVIHPMRSYIHDRPSWLSYMPGRWITIPKKVLPKNGSSLIRVFAADSPSDAVPLDQVLVREGLPTPALRVNSERLRFTVQPYYQGTSINRLFR